jgi:cytochrome c-type biogenesis protein CcmH/NrfF
MTGPSQFEIEEALTCQCGCGLTVHSCNHLQCPSGIPLKKEIAAEIAKGGTREAVLTHFAQKYGEKILSAPTTSGFNLVAWVTPFAAIFIAAAVIVLFIRRWRRRAVPAAVIETPVPDRDDAERRARLRAELERFDT